MSIYIISNRKVVEQGGQLRFNEDGKEKALPTFRIAEYFSDSNYEILKDTETTDYSLIGKALNNKYPEEQLKGTCRMFYDIYNQLINSKKQSDVLVFIHGFATGFNDALNHIETLKEKFMNKSSPIKHLIYITYPTRDNIYFTYRGDQDDAETTGIVLARVYNKLIELFTELFYIQKRNNCHSKFHLAVHSMGNQVLKSMLETIPERKIFPFFEEVLLLHSDVEDTVFEPGEPFTKLEKLAARTHIYIHNSDDALWISRLTKNFNKRLGKKGPKDRKSLNDETFIVDTTKVNEPAILRERVVDHWGYVENDVQIKDIIEVLKGTQAEDIEYRDIKAGERNHFFLRG